MSLFDQDAVRLAALSQIIQSTLDAGQQPRQEWLDERDALLRRAAATSPSPTAAPSPPTTPIFSGPPRAAIPDSPGERVSIVVDEDMQRVVDSVLAVWAKRYCVFQTSGRLFEIQIDKSHKQIKFLTVEPPLPRLVQVGAVRARALASRECRFGTEKLTKDGPTLASCLPPDWLGSNITTRTDLDIIPPLHGLAQAPTLRRDGALISERGYDTSTGIYLACDMPLEIPDAPTQVDARVAMGRILDLVSDFSFANEAGRSAWVAGLLSIAARHTFEGPVPIVIIDASKRGSGKTLLVDIANLITTGTKAARMFFVSDDAEMDKRITAIALAAESTILIDNIAGKLSSVPLDAALTSDTYKGRVLGKTEMTLAVPLKTVWFATGNGLLIGGDIARRALMVRLVPEVDRPEERSGPRPGEAWRYPDLAAYVREHRAEILGYALTVVRAYILAGRPSLGLKPMGSFEGWSNTIRNAIVFAGAADPCLTVADARSADAEDYALRFAVDAWPIADEEEVTAGELLEWAEIETPLAADMATRAAFDRSLPLRKRWRSALLEWIPEKSGALPTVKNLGYALRSLRDIVVDDYRIVAGGQKTKKGIAWKRVCTSFARPQAPNPPNLSVVK